jgi:LPPG:FO 2-phospho-L-lactate transferase
MEKEIKVVALAGGVGGAKLALGLAKILSPDDLVIVVNTGDDECFHGLHVSPDLDTVMYTLAGLVNLETGWGIAGDTFETLGMLRRYGEDTWFNIGDRDMATHIRRTQLLKQGSTLSEVTAELCHGLGVAHRVIPMSNDAVRTMLVTDERELAMQDYFVRRACEPVVQSVRYDGARAAGVAPELMALLDHARLVVFCPSNPFLSLGPMLAIPGMVEQLCRRSGHLVAVSPIVGGSALRGPAGKIMAEIGYQVSSVGIAEYYRGICDTLLIDYQDAALSPAISKLGIKAIPASIIMETDADKVALAEQIVALGGT